MSSAPYESLLDLDIHRDSINALAFSLDGRYLATGGDDFLLFVVNPSTGTVVHKLEGASPVTAIEWHPHDATRLFVGYGTGRVLVAHVGSDTLNGWFLPRSTSNQPVEDIACDTYDGVHRLLICAGKRVELWQEIGELHWVEHLLEPPAFIMAHAQQTSSTEVVARSGHMACGGKIAVITYLNHGIACWDIASRLSFLWHMLPRTGRLGRSTISSTGALLVASNLYDGFDMYCLDTRTHARTFAAPGKVNVPLPVLMTGDEVEIITGTSCGAVNIFDPHTGNERFTLDHSGDIVQALAYCDSNGTRLLATGTSERGQATLVRVWRRQLDPPGRGQILGSGDADPLERPTSSQHSDNSSQSVDQCDSPLRSEENESAFVAPPRRRSCGMIASGATCVPVFLVRLIQAFTGLVWGTLLMPIVGGLVGFQKKLYLHVFRCLWRLLGCVRVSRHRSVVLVVLVVVSLVIFLGILYDQESVGADVVVWRKPSDHGDSWVAFTQYLSDIVWRAARYLGIGSIVAGKTIKKASLVAVKGSADASVFVAHVSVRVLNGYIIYMRGG